jgi:hypothetical protein
MIGGLKIFYAVIIMIIGLYLKELGVLDVTGAYMFYDQQVY